MTFSEFLTTNQRADFITIGLDPDLWFAQMTANFAKQAAALQSQDKISKLSRIPSNVIATIEATIDDEYRKANP